MTRSPAPPAECPVCGEAVPPSARACPGCGADERTGWDEEATRADGLDLPAEAFAGPEDPPAPWPGRRLLWTAVALGLLAVLIAGVLRR